MNVGYLEMDKPQEWKSLQKGECCSSFDIFKLYVYSNQYLPNITAIIRFNQ